MKTQTKTNSRSALQYTGILFGLIVMIALSSCQTKKTKQQIARLEFSKDSLVQNIHQRDSILGDMMNAFSQIEQSLEYIKTQRKLISSTTDDPELAENKKDQIVKDVQTLTAMLEENTKRLNDLNRQLKNSGIKIASLEKRIQELTIEAENRNNDIIALKSELEKKDFEIAQLNTQVTDLTTTKVQQEGVIDKQTSELNELNTAYFTSGTAKELKEKGLITKEGGFLGIGKIKTLSASAKNEYFTTFDIRNTFSFPVQAGQAKLITEHPAGSYKFVKENDQIASLEISNPKEFYKYSKYIVMEIKK
jgi:predicted RNase H-like nuclease (RuvC/YqgF family)